MRGFVILHVVHGLFLGDCPSPSAPRGEPVWSKCCPPPEIDAAPVFPTIETAVAYAQTLRVGGMLMVQEAEADRVAPWGMVFASMGLLATQGFEPWLQPGTPCVGPPQ